MARIPWNGVSRHRVLPCSARPFRRAAPRKADARRPRGHHGPATRLVLRRQGGSGHAPMRADRRRRDDARRIAWERGVRNGAGGAVSDREQLNHEAPAGLCRVGGGDTAGAHSLIVLTPGRAVIPSHCPGRVRWGFEIHSASRSGRTFTASRQGSPPATKTRRTDRSPSRSIAARPSCIVSAERPRAAASPSGWCWRSFAATSSRRRATRGAIRPPCKDRGRGTASQRGCASCPQEISLYRVSVFAHHI